MDINLNKGKLSKMIQSRVVLCSTQGKLGKKVISDLAIFYFIGKHSSFKCSK